jgi:hypothetical protein
METTLSSVPGQPLGSLNTPVAGNFIDSTMAPWRIMNRASLQQLAGLTPWARITASNPLYRDDDATNDNMEHHTEKILERIGHFGTDRLSLLPPLWVVPPAQTQALTELRQREVLRERAAAVPMDEDIIRRRDESRARRKRALQALIRSSSIFTGHRLPPKRRMLNVHVTVPFHSISPADITRQEVAEAWAHFLHE